MQREPATFVNRFEAADAQVARTVTAERRAFLEEAFMSHLGPEIGGNLAEIVDSYATGGHLSFNGMRYETPEALVSFHRNFGFDGHGMIRHIGGEIVHMFYTFDAVVAEFVMRGVVAVELAGAPAGREVTFHVCGVYCFDEAGKLSSERIYLDTGKLLPQPFFRP